MREEALGWLVGGLRRKKLKTAPIAPPVWGEVGGRGGGGAGGGRGGRGKRS